MSNFDWKRLCLYHEFTQPWERYGSSWEWMIDHENKKIKSFAVDDLKNRLIKENVIGRRVER